MDTTINLRFLLTIKRGLQTDSELFSSDLYRMLICSCSEYKTDTYSADLKHQEPLVADIVVRRADCEPILKKRTIMVRPNITNQNLNKNQIQLPNQRLLAFH